MERVLYGKQILLRELTINDASAIYDIMSNPETTHYWRSQVTSLIDCERMLHVEFLSYHRQGLPVPYAIVLQETNQVVGFCNFNYEEEETGEIGFMIHHDVEHRGIMQEALKLLIEKGFSKYGYTRVVARVMAGNEKSCRCLERFGFRKEGVLKEAIRVNKERKDVIVYALLDREWEEIK